MNYRLLGRTGVQVSQLCFGTMSFGGDALKIEMSRALWNEMAALSRTPPPATDRLEEQKKG